MFIPPAVYTKSVDAIISIILRFCDNFLNHFVRLIIKHTNVDYFNIPMYEYILLYNRVDYTDRKLKRGERLQTYL